jgi:hypothetical protein
MRNTVDIAYNKIDGDLIKQIDTSIKLPHVDTTGMVTIAVKNLKKMDLDE